LGSVSSAVTGLTKSTVFIKRQRTNRRQLLAGFMFAACFAPLLSAASAEALPDAGLQVWNGDLKPLFSLDRIDGGTEALADRLNRVVLVHFFATWCEPCRREIGSLAQLSKRLPQDRFTIIGVDVAEVDVRVKRFFASLPVTFPIALDRDGNVAKAWSVDALPTTFVLDRNLTPRFHVQGDLDWNRPAIDRLLAALSEERNPKKQAAGAQPKPIEERS
jgi:thiol-disulfide isomerase/thioredoxin